jgi:tripartite-type tricarboxylate transporter receptor subunit TctC
LLGCASALFMLNACGAPSAYPSRPLTMIVPWGAGGGTDAVARTLATLMEQDLGQPINVVNRTGGSGVVGHQALAEAPADGYTIGIITSEIAMMHHQGLTSLTSEAFTPLGMVNYDAAGIQVRTDSGYATLADLMQAIRANPGKLKGSGTAQGGIWHVAFYGLLHEQGIPPTSVPWVPSASSAAGLLELLNGGVDIVPVSHPEVRSMIDAGRVKSLGLMADAPSALYPDVPLVQQAIGSTWRMGVWRGIGAPKNLPAEIETRLRDALKKAYDSPAYQEFSKSRGFELRWAGPEEFRTVMAETDVQMGETMRSVGLAK